MENNNNPNVFIKPCTTHIDILLHNLDVNILKINYLWNVLVQACNKGFNRL